MTSDSLATSPRSGHSLQAAIQRGPSACRGYHRRIQVTIQQGVLARYAVDVHVPWLIPNSGRRTRLGLLAHGNDGRRQILPQIGTHWDTARGG